MIRASIRSNGFDRTGTLTVLFGTVMRLAHGTQASSQVTTQLVVQVDPVEGEPLSFPAVPYGPSVSVSDWNDDGDDDLIIGTAYGYFCWFERSFLDRGIAKAAAGEP